MQSVVKKVNYNIIFTLLLLIIIFAGNKIQVYGKENEYRLQENDLLIVSIWGHPDLSGDVRVGPDGEISLPLIGAMDVEGLSITELNSLLKEKLSEYIKDPSINIVLREYHRPQVMILGEVRSPGRYQLESNRGILQLVSSAGGPTERADLNQITLLRNEETILLNLEGFLEARVDISNYILEDGDVLYFPKGKKTVTIMGEVKRPGRYELDAEADLLELIAVAGGITTRADRELKYTSTEGIEMVEIEGLLDGSLEEVPFLEDGDQVYIPETINEVSIYGEIKRPGVYSWKEGLRLSELLAAAGNQTGEGDISEIVVYTEDNSSYHVDFGSYLEEGDSAANPLIKPGDSVYINKKIFEVAILGEVNKPGTYRWHQEMNLDRLLAVAGNPTKRGDLSNIKITRQDGSTQEVNLEEYLDNSETGENPLLQPGDIVRVEELKGINWEKVFNALAGLNLLKDLLIFD